MATPPESNPAPPKPAPLPPVDGADEIIPGVRVPPSAMRFQYARSGGPGGQNVNKLNTKAELWVPLGAIQGMSERAMDRLRQMAGKRLTAAGEIHIAAETERTQEGNRSAVLDRLRELLEKAKREPKVRRKTKPTRASKRRRLDAKRRRGEIKAGRRGHE